REFFKIGVVVEYVLDADPLPGCPGEEVRCCRFSGVEDFPQRYRHRSGAERMDQPHLVRRRIPSDGFRRDLGKHGAVGALADIHDRMPLMVDADHADAWLDPSTENVGDVLDAAMDAAPSMVHTLDDRVIGSAVGNVRNNGPELIQPAPDAA
ncbi:MAG: SOS response-associated peptidase family protein, partial [Microbacterium chocolatum]|nr:SOS response-associated peptidase family protein [Microbacterium chocolatum]